MAKEFNRAIANHCTIVLLKIFTCDHTGRGRKLWLTKLHKCSNFQLQKYSCNLQILRRAIIHTYLTFPDWKTLFIDTQEKLDLVEIVLDKGNCQPHSCKTQFSMTRLWPCCEATFLLWRYSQGQCFSIFKNRYGKWKKEAHVQSK